MSQISVLVKDIHARFIRSAAKFGEAPKFSCAEFCVAGRSNVGKSSFISHVLNFRNLARSSKEPGKTRLANFFHVTDSMVWVDLPGYGYAHAPGEEKAQWSNLLHDYISQRENLAGIIWLIDIRHPGLPADIAAYQWMTARRIPLMAVLTKRDKVGSSIFAQHRAQFQKLFGKADCFTGYSILDQSSRQKFWDIFNGWAGGLVG